MKILTILILSLLTSIQLLGQTSLSKYKIGDSGCSAYFFAEPSPAQLSYSPDSSKVYEMQSTDPDGITCYSITVLLSIELGRDEISGILKSYLDYLKEQYKIIVAAGYGEGNTLTTHPSAIGIRDNWSDAESDMALMSYSDGKIIEVMIVFANEKGKDISSKSEVFFKGFRFPGD
jgi:hypothetical protein